MKKKAQAKKTTSKLISRQMNRLMKFLCFFKKQKSLLLRASQTRPWNIRFGFCNSQRFYLDIYVFPIVRTNAFQFFLSCWTLFLAEVGRFTGMKLENIKRIMLATSFLFIDHQNKWSNSKAFVSVLQTCKVVELSKKKFATPLNWPVTSKTSSNPQA